MDTAGNLYGTANMGGGCPGQSSYGCGTVFMLSPSSTGWNEIVLHSFCSQTNCGDGANPAGDLIMDGAGNLYGVTPSGGGTFYCDGFHPGCGVVLRLNPSAGYTLSVAKSGNGSGTVTSSPPGIDCGSTCGAGFSPGTQVTLTATPASGSTFTGWGGACSGTGVCMVTINGNISVTAGFAANTYALSVSVIGSSGGKVASSPSGIDCGATCNASFSAGSQVTLTATPAGGWMFGAWGGECSGAGSCNVTMNASLSALATFWPIPFAFSGLPAMPTDPTAPLTPRQ